MKGALQSRCLLLATYIGLPGRGFGVDWWVSGAGASWDLYRHPLPFWPCLP